MDNNTTQAPEERSHTSNSELARRIDTGAWAALFIWIGSSILADLGWGWFLLGVGFIVLAAQALQRRAGESFSSFWLICAGILVVAGAWDLLELQWPLAPILVILVGVGLISGVFFSSRNSPS